MSSIKHIALALLLVPLVGEAQGVAAASPGLPPASPVANASPGTPQG